jgi:hypothetical protein
LLVGKLPNSAYTWVAIPPGQYEVKTSLHSLTGEERPFTTLATEGGKKYYVRVLIERFDSSVTSVNASEAENEMKSTQYIRPAQDRFIE